jgi:hypothetical protein
MLVVSEWQTMLWRCEIVKDRYEEAAEGALEPPPQFNCGLNLDPDRFA